MGGWGAAALAGCNQPSRSRTCWSVRPEILITLFRLVWPAAIVTDERGRFKSFAKNSMQASLALPSTGGAVRASLRTSPTSPVMAFFFARGWTFTAKVTPLGEFFIAGIERPYHRGHRGAQRKTTEEILEVLLCFLCVSLCSSVSPVVKLLLSPRRSPFLHVRTLLPLQLRLRNHATCPSRDLRNRFAAGRTQ